MSYFLLKTYLTTPTLTTTDPTSSSTSRHLTCPTTTPKNTWRRSSKRSRSPSFLAGLTFLSHYDSWMLHRACRCRVSVCIRSPASFPGTCTTRIDKSAALDASDPDERLPAAVTDRIVEDNGEFYDGEKEGGDLRNGQSYKRAASPIVNSTKRAKEET